MKKYAVVWVTTEESLLVKWYGDHYEVEAKGHNASLKKLVGILNGEPDV